jgi:hypothetical protein
VLAPDGRRSGRFVERRALELPQAAEVVTDDASAGIDQGDDSDDGMSAVLLGDR